MLPKFLRIRDDLSWQQFGAPDQRYFDRYIKDCDLIVLEHTGAYYEVQDPTDPEGVFSVSADWVAEPIAKILSIAHPKRRSA